MSKPIRSRAAAIEAWCKGCNYDPEERGTWRQQVGACTITRCPFYDFRPMPRQEQAVAA